MRLLRRLLLLLIGVAMVLLGVANMQPVDLRLVPEEIGGPDVVVRGLPMAAVLLGAMALGLVAGFLLEWLREARHRRLAAERRQEIARLRDELSRVGSRLRDSDADLADLPSP